MHRIERDNHTIGFTWNSSTWVKTTRKYLSRCDKNPENVSTSTGQHSSVKENAPISTGQHSSDAICNATLSLTPISQWQYRPSLNTQPMPILAPTGPILTMSAYINLTHIYKNNVLPSSLQNLCHLLLAYLVFYHSSITFSCVVMFFDQIFLEPIPLSSHTFSFVFFLQIFFYLLDLA